MQVLKRRYQDALYWPPAGIDADGVRQYGEVQQLKVRWEDVNEAVTTAGGMTIVSRSKVFTGIDVVQDGVLWLGKEADAVSLVAPFDNPGAFAIMKFSKIPNPRATDYLRIAWL